MQVTPSATSAPVPPDLRRLAAGIANEVRNPLTVIKTMMYAMRLDLHAEDPRSADFNVVDREIDRIEQSIQQLLDYSWPPDPQLATIDLAHIISRALERLQDRAQAQNVRIEALLNAEAMIQADAGQLEQVFVDLGSNALRAMPAGGALAIEATTERVFVNLSLKAMPTGTAGYDSPTGGQIAAADVTVAGDPDSVEAAVAETDAPISLDVLDHLFEPYPAEGGAHGSGLQLAIVQQIVTRHGGRVAASLLPKGGATFLVILPLVL